MKQRGAFETKTHLSEILVDVEQGETYVVTRHGAKVAMIIPYAVDKENAIETPVSGAIRAIKHMSRGVTLGEDLSIDMLRKEGRR